METPIKRTLLLAALMLVLPAAAAAADVRADVSSARPAIAAGNLPGCVTGTLSNPRPFMKRFSATVLRVVVSPPWGAQGQALPCINGARSEGYGVELVIGWDSSWSLARTKRFFRRVLDIYRGKLWAVGIGNEQEISPRMSSAAYARAWRALEPIVKATTPHAIRVGGEISPWGLSFLKGALHIGLPGIQAIGAHPYRYPWAPKVAQLLGLARQYHLPLWCDEGLLDGRYSWHPARDVPLSAMRGAALAGVWDDGH